MNKRRVLRVFLVAAGLAASVSVYSQFPGGGMPGFGFDMMRMRMPGWGMPGFGGDSISGFGGGVPRSGGGMPGAGMMGIGMMGGTSFSASQLSNHIDFESSSLPIVIITTDGNPIGNAEKVDARMKIVNNGGGRRNSIADKATDYDGKIGIRLRGNSSLSFEQKSFTLETRNEDGSNNDVALLGMPADNDWALVAPYNDISMIRNVLAYQMWNDMDHWGPRTAMVEVVMDGEYIGVYTFTETIKRDKNRISIANLKPEDNSGREITGGYILRIDAYDQDDLTFQSKVPGLSSMGSMMSMGSMPSMMQMPSMGSMPGMGGPGIGFGGDSGASAGNLSNPVVWTIRTPKKEDITDEQKAYIENYIHEMEAAILSDDFADPDKGYAKYISVSSFVDYLIHTEVSLNADGLKRSAYFFKKKQNEDGTGGKLHAGTVWDFNLAYGNCNFCNADDVTAWVYEGGETSPTPFFWKRLLEDPAFLAKVKARYTELRKGVLSQRNIEAFIDTYAKMLSEAQQRQYSKYDGLLVDDEKSSGTGSGNGFGRGSMGGQMGGQMGGGFGGGPMGGFGGGMMGFGGGSADQISWYAAYRVSSYDEEIKTLKQWFAKRLAFLDSHWLE